MHCGVGSVVLLVLSKIIFKKIFSDVKRWLHYTADTRCITRLGSKLKKNKDFYCVVVLWLRGLIVFLFLFVAVL